MQIYLLNLILVVLVYGEQANVKRIKKIVTEDVFDYLFPFRNMQAGPEPYSYYGFIEAAKKFPEFCNEAGRGQDLDTACKRELATAFAHFGQETGDNSAWGEIPPWRQGLYYSSQIGCTPKNCPYCYPNAKYPCTHGQGYYGRGALQIKNNSNYGQFSEAIYGDKQKLLDDPDSVLTAENGSLAFSSAIWLMTKKSRNQPSIHDIVVGKWKPTKSDKAAGRLPGFGITTLIIAEPECNPGADSDANRASYYESLAEYFGISAGTNLHCDGMKPF